MSKPDAPALDDFEWPHETKLWTDTSVEMSLQPDRVRALGWEDGMRIAFWPVLDGDYVVWDVGPAEDDSLRNTAKLRIRSREPPEHVDDSRVGKYENAYLRWPLEFAVERGIYSQAERGDATALLSPSPRGEEFVRLDVWPPSELFAVDGERTFGPIYKRAVDSPSGPTGTKTEVHIPAEVVSELDLEGGQPLAGRLTVHDGRLALAFDTDVGDDESDAAHVRRLVKSTTTSGGSGEYELLKLRISRPYAHALSITDADVSLVVEGGCLVVQALA